MGKVKNMKIVPNMGRILLKQENCDAIMNTIPNANTQTAAVSGFSSDGAHTSPF